MIDPELLAESQTVTTRTLRQFAALWLILLATLSVWSLYRGHDGRAVVFAALALAAGPLGLVRPNAIRPLFSALMAVTTPIGMVVTRLILSVLFYGIFTPLGLLFKAIGRDALSRARDPVRQSYWVTRSPRSNARRYFRQF